MKTFHPTHDPAPFRNLETGRVYILCGNCGRVVEGATGPCAFPGSGATRDVYERDIAGLTVERDAIRAQYARSGARSPTEPYRSPAGYGLGATVCQAFGRGRPRQGLTR